MQSVLHKNRSEFQEDTGLAIWDKVIDRNRVGEVTMAGRAEWMIYDANGYTGHLVAVEARRRACTPYWPAGVPAQSRR